MVEHHRQEEVVSGESFWNVILELKNRLSKYEFAQNIVSNNSSKKLEIQLYVLLF